MTVRADGQEFRRSKAAVGNDKPMGEDGPGHIRETAVLGAPDFLASQGVIAVNAEGTGNDHLVPAGNANEPGGVLRRV